MFTHVMVGSNDIARARRFYEAALTPLGLALRERAGRLYYGDGDTLFSVTPPRDGGPATVANGGTIGFLATSVEAVDAFHAGGVANGGTDEGPPGYRNNSRGARYGAYLRDPDGNKLCAFGPFRDEDKQP